MEFIDKYNGGVVDNPIDAVNQDLEKDLIEEFGGEEDKELGLRRKKEKKKGDD